MGVEGEVVMPNVDEPDPLLIEGRVKLAPLGTPETVKSTVPVNPPDADTFTE